MEARFLIGIIAKRAVAALPLLFILSIVSFSLIRVLPGDPVEAMMGGNTHDIDPNELSYLKHEFGLDQPISKQYLAWLKGFIGQGELGRSYQDNRKVLVVIGERIPSTITLVALALMISFTLGISWGLLMVMMRFRFGSRLLEFPFLSAALLLYSCPAFFIGLMLIYFVTFNQWLKGIPLFGSLSPEQSANPSSLFQYALLPAFTLGINRSAKIALFVRSLALDEISRNYVVTALAKGMSHSSVLLRHVARNCMAPVINLAALSLPTLIGGSVLIETIFAWPGTGRLAVEATFGRNFPVMTTLVMIYGCMVVISNLLADIVQTLVDPRLLADSKEHKSLEQ